MKPEGGRGNWQRDVRLAAAALVVPAAVLAAAAVIRVFASGPTAAGASVAGSVLLAAATALVPLTLLLFRRIRRAEEWGRQAPLAADPACFGAMLDAADCTVVAADWQGRIIAATPEASRILGASAGVPISFRDDEPFRSVLQHLAADGRHVCREFVFARRGGERYRLTGSALVVRGRPVGAILTLADIRKERTLERLEMDFLTRVSHRLRTPLSSITWMTEFLAEGEAGPVNRRQRRLLHDIDATVRRLTRLVNDLLFLTRIESGTFAFHPVRTDLAVLAKHVAREVASLCRKRGIALALDLPEGAPAVSVDPTLFHRVLHVLVKNAVSYTRRGGSVRLAVRRARGGVRLEVADTGVGIPAADRERVFQKFFRGDTVMREETDGHGLGLYTAKAIVEASGGSISFVSKEGRGSTFYVSLPARQAGAGEPASGAGPRA